MNTDLHFVYGDLLTYPADYIVQQVNCQGVMGAGLAKQIRAVYPKLFMEYALYCSEHAHDRRKLLSRFLIHERVINVFGQLNFGYDKNTVYTDYKALEHAFHVLQYTLPYDKTLAFPCGFGCGLANGNWQTVLELIKTSFPGRTVYIVQKK